VASLILLAPTTSDGYSAIAYPPRALLWGHNSAAALAEYHWHLSLYLPYQYTTVHQADCKPKATPVLSDVAWRGTEPGILVITVRITGASSSNGVRSHVRCVLRRIQPFEVCEDR
jgi:hypothetical protein